jgi:hypothetical protein
VAQINELSDRLAAPKTGGSGDRGSKPRGEAKTDTKTVVDEAKAKKNPAPVSRPAKKAAVTETSFAATPPPRNVRAPKTRFTNPLTGTITTPPVSKAKKQAVQELTDGSLPEGGKSGGGAASGGAPADLKTELQQMQQRLTYLEAVAEQESLNFAGEVVSAEEEEEADYPDQPTFR